MVENPNVTGPPPGGNGSSMAAAHTPLQPAEVPLDNEPAAPGPSLGLAMVETVVNQSINQILFV